MTAFAGCMACMSVQTGVLVQESELVEARLERSQAQAKAQRAQQRLDDFLAQQPAPQVYLQPFLSRLPSVCLVFEDEWMDNWMHGWTNE